MSEVRAEGWHPDPNGTPLERYHDGSGWTPQLRYPTTAVVRPPSTPPKHSGGLPIPSAVPTGGPTAPHLRPKAAPEEGPPRLPPISHPRVEEDRAQRAASNAGKKTPAAALSAGQRGPLTTTDPEDMSLPLAHAELGNTFMRPWKGYFQFHGRCGRAEFWYGYLWMVILSFIPLVTIIPTYSLMVRRLHDVNRSGWWVALPLLTMGASAVILFMSLLQLWEAAQGAEVDGAPLGLASLGVLFFGLMSSLLILVWLCSPSNPEGVRFDKRG